MTNGRRNAIVRQTLMALFAAAAVQVSVYAPAWACVVCQGNRDSDQVKGAEAGVLTMVLITYGVLMCFGAMVVACFVRSRKLRRAAASSETQGS